MTISPLLLLLALAAINALTLYSFWDDKARAVAGRRRISERDLLALAFIGGTPAAFAGRHLFRHKTRKQPFTALLWLIATFQAAVLLYWMWGAR